VALKTIEIDNQQFDGKALQVRVVESKEPAHFMSIFGGKIITYQVGLKKVLCPKFKSLSF